MSKKVPLSPHSSDYSEISELLARPQTSNVKEIVMSNKTPPSPFFPDFPDSSEILATPQTSNVKVLAAFVEQIKELQKKLGKNKTDMEKVLVICIQHIIDTEHLVALRELQVRKANLFVMGKIYSTDEDIINEFNQFFTLVRNNKENYSPYCDFSAKFDEEIDNYLGTIQKHIATTKEKINQIIILDDGGACITRVMKSEVWRRIVKDNGLKICGVEQTSAGLRKITELLKKYAKAARHREETSKVKTTSKATHQVEISEETEGEDEDLEDELNKTNDSENSDVKNKTEADNPAKFVFPIIFSGSSAAKYEIESKFIADAIAHSIFESLSDLTKNPETNIGIIGGGNIGKSVAEKFSKHMVYIYDRDLGRRKGCNSVEKLIINSDIILGCTGTDCLKYQLEFVEINNNTSINDYIPTEFHGYLLCHDNGGERKWFLTTKYIQGMDITDVIIRLNLDLKKITIDNLISSHEFKTIYNALDEKYHLNDHTEFLNKLKSAKRFISGSSGNIEFKTLVTTEKEKKYIFKADKVLDDMIFKNIEGVDIILVRGSYPINLKKLSYTNQDGKKYTEFSVPKKYIQLTLTLLLAGVVQAFYTENKNPERVMDYIQILHPNMQKFIIYSLCKHVRELLTNKTITRDDIEAFDDLEEINKKSYYEYVKKSKDTGHSDQRRIGMLDKTMYQQDIAILFPKDGISLSSVIPIKGQNYRYFAERYLRSTTDRLYYLFVINFLVIKKEKSNRSTEELHNHQHNLPRHELPKASYSLPALHSVPWSNRENYNNKNNIIMLREDYAETQDKTKSYIQKLNKNHSLTEEREMSSSIRLIKHYFSAKEFDDLFDNKSYDMNNLLVKMNKCLPSNDISKRTLETDIFTIFINTTKSKYMAGLLKTYSTAKEEIYELQKAILECECEFEELFVKKTKDDRDLYYLKEYPEIKNLLIRLSVYKWFYELVRGTSIKIPDLSLARYKKIPEDYVIPIDYSVAYNKKDLFDVIGINNRDKDVYYCDILSSILQLKYEAKAPQQDIDVIAEKIIKLTDIIRITDHNDHTLRYILSTILRFKYETDAPQQDKSDITKRIIDLPRRLADNEPHDEVYYGNILLYILQLMYELKALSQDIDDITKRIFTLTESPSRYDVCFPNLLLGLLQLRYKSNAPQQDIDDITKRIFMAIESSRIKGKNSYPPFIDAKTIAICYNDNNIDEKAKKFPLKYKNIAVAWYFAARSYSKSISAFSWTLVPNYDYYIKAITYFDKFIRFSAAGIEQCDDINFPSFRKRAEQRRSELLNQMFATWWYTDGDFTSLSLIDHCFKATKKLIKTTQHKDSFEKFKVQARFLLDYYSSSYLNLYQELLFEADDCGNNTVFRWLSHFIEKITQPGKNGWYISHWAAANDKVRLLKSILKRCPALWTRKTTVIEMFFFRSGGLSMSDIAKKYNSQKVLSFLDQNLEKTKRHPDELTTEKSRPDHYQKSPLTPIPNNGLTFMQMTKKRIMKKKRKIKKKKFIKRTMDKLNLDP